MSRRDVDPRARELLERFDLADAADRTARTYSGGMRRRLDVAAALVHRPPVLFLDEPTTGLDIQSRTELWAVIRELVSEGATVLLTTQYLEEADRLADRIAVVDHGHVVANDTSTGLKSRLAGTVIAVGMETEDESRRVEELLAHINGDRPQREGRLVRLASHGGPRVLADVLRALDANGLAPSTFTVSEPTLDDVFLTLTGRPAEGAADGDGGRREASPARGRDDHDEEPGTGAGVEPTEGGRHERPRRGAASHRHRATVVPAGGAARRLGDHRPQPDHLPPRAARCSCSP